jgi:hypothetical protein
LIIPESSVEHREEYVCGSAVQGTTHWVCVTNSKVSHIFSYLVEQLSGQLRNLGLWAAAMYETHALILIVPDSLRR